MHSKFHASWTRLLCSAVVTAIVVTLTGCGPSVSGTYLGVPGKSVFEKIELQSGGKVIVTLIGITHEATYEVKGAKIVVNNGGEMSELTIDSNGCLVDALGGTYCKDGGASASASDRSDDTKSGSKSGSFSGTYEAKGANGAAMTITFQSESKFSIGMNMPGANNVAQGTYEVRGDHVLLTVTGDDEALDLTRKGKTLEGSLGGDLVTFIRK